MENFILLKLYHNLVHKNTRVTAQDNTTQHE